MLSKTIQITLICIVVTACETKAQKAETAFMREQLIASGQSTKPADELREKHIGKNLAITSAAVLTSPIWVPLAIVSWPALGL